MQSNSGSNHNAQGNVFTDSNTQANEESECATKISKQIELLHKEELRSVLSKEFKVSGSDGRVTGTYILCDEVLGFRQVFKREVADNLPDTEANNVNTFYIYYLPDHEGWRLGNKQSYWQSGRAPGSYYYTSIVFEIKLIYSS